MMDRYFRSMAVARLSGAKHALIFPHLDLIAADTCESHVGSSQEYLFHRNSCIPATSFKREIQRVIHLRCSCFGTAAAVSSVMEDVDCSGDNPSALRRLADRIQLSSTIRHRCPMR